MQNYKTAQLRSKAGMIIAALTMMFLVTSCASAVNYRDDGVYEARVGYYPGSLLSFPAFVAQEKGFYENNGLEVELISIPDGSAMTAAVANGSISFGNNSYDNLSIAIDQDLPIKAISGNTTSLPIAMIARDGLDTPNLDQGYPAIMDDLKGKNLGVIGLGISVHYLTEILVADSGHQLNEITIIAAGLPDAARPALQQGTIDTYTSLWPLPAIVEAQGEGRILVDFSSDDVPESLRDLNYNGWWASEHTIDADPEAVQRFAKANEEAICWAKDPENADELVEILQDTIPVPQLTDDQYKAMVDQILPAYGSEITRDSVDRWQELLVNQSLLEEPVQYADFRASTTKEQVKCT